MSCLWTSKPSWYFLVKRLKRKVKGGVKHFVGNPSQSYGASPVIWVHTGECTLASLQPDKSVLNLLSLEGWKAELT